MQDALELERAELETVALDRHERLGPERVAGGDRTAQVAEPLFADRERDRETGQGEALDDVDGDSQRSGVVADAGAGQTPAVAARLERCPSGKTVST